MKSLWAAGRAAMLLANACIAYDYMTRLQEGDEAQNIPYNNSSTTKGETHSVGQHQLSFKEAIVDRKVTLNLKCITMQRTCCLYENIHSHKTKNSSNKYGH